MFKKHIPNTITCGNLVCGCIATHFAFQGSYSLALTFIIAGAVFDFFDGFMARLLHVSSPIGKELDSLADDITFGFAPSAMLYHLLTTVPAAGIHPVIDRYLPYAAFVMAALSALRLAKFNLDERQATSFIGLPTPANALFWGSLATNLHQNGWLAGEPWLVWLIVPLILFSCWILVCEIPMFALKFKTYGLQGNILRYSFILCSLVLLGSLGWAAGFCAIIVLYVLTSVMNNIIGTKIVETE